MSYLSRDCLLTIADSYKALGMPYKSTDFLNCIDESDLGVDSLKYYYIKASSLDSLNNTTEALKNYKIFYDLLLNNHEKIFQQKLQTSEDRYKLQLEFHKDTKKRESILWLCLVTILILSTGIVILFLILRNNRTLKKLAIQNEINTKLENNNLKIRQENLILEKNKLELTNNNLILENTNYHLQREKDILEVENLRHRISYLEKEQDELRTVLKSQTNLPQEVRQAIKNRFDMLNSLLASIITDNDKYQKAYKEQVTNLLVNTSTFMNNMRLAFEGTHPMFINYFVKHGLTTDEINYICMYAIGLSGKDIGIYMKKSSHVNMSSAIRKKLGMDMHDTNLGIYVRQILDRF